MYYHYYANSKIPLVIGHTLAINRDINNVIMSLAINECTVLRSRSIKKIFWIHIWLKIA